MMRPRVSSKIEKIKIETMNIRTNYGWMKKLSRNIREANCKGVESRVCRGRRSLLSKSRSQLNGERFIFQRRGMCGKHARVVELRVLMRRRVVKWFK